MIAGRFLCPLAACLALATVLFPAAPSIGQPQSNAAWYYDNSTLENGIHLRSWLLCGPFPNPVEGGGPCLHDRTCTGFYTDYLAPIGGETGCAPQAQLEVPAPDGTYRKWTGVEALGDRLYFDDYLAAGEFQTAYAVCWIDATEADDRLFSVGSNDGIRIWVNGQEVFRYHAGRAITPDENYLRLPLREGRNQILVKLDNGTGRWGFTMRPVANDFAMDEVIPRIRKVLRFDFEVLEDAFSLTFGDPTVIGNFNDLPAAEITLLDSAGEQVHRFEATLCRPMRLPFSDFPEKEYMLEGKVLWPRRGRVVIPGMLYRGDLRDEVRSLVTGPGPDLPDCRPATAYADLRASVAGLEAVDGFRDEPYAYRRLKTGLTRALEDAVALQNTTSPYARLYPAPRQYGVSGHALVAVTGNWTLQIEDSIFDEPLRTALADRWAKLTGALAGSGASGEVRVVALEPGTRNIPTVELEGEAAAPDAAAVSLAETVPEDPEGYAIHLSPDGITVAGRTAAGAFYGLDTLFQLIAQAAPTETGERKLDGGTIIDAPHHQTRAVVHPLESYDATFRDRIDQLAALRYNMVFLPSSLYPDVDDGEIQPMLIAAYAYCRSRFIEPIPLVETFGADTLAARLDADLWEGVYHEEMPVTVDDLRRLHLPYDRLLVSPATRPRLRTGAGYKILREGRDFAYESFAPPVIQLKGRAPVQTGDVVLVSADLVDRSIASTPASCPSDSDAWLLTEAVMEKIYAHLAPRGVHLGNTGAGYLNRDSRCLDREMPNALILADAMQKGYDIVRKLDRDAEIFIWGDHFNPLQRSRALDAIKAPQHLPRDITVLDWHYHSASYYDVWRVDQGIRYFDQFGFDTMGVVRNDPLNVAQLAALKRRHPQRYRGIVFRPRDPGDSGVYLAAGAGWQGTTALGQVTP